MDKQNEVINILCALDENFVQHCGVMLTSLFENNKSEKINVYLFTDGLTENSLARLMQLVESYHSRLTVKTVDMQKLKDFPLQDSKGLRYSLAAYYRIMMVELLPADVKKIIYLDCDLIVRSRIRELWETDVEDYAIAAIDDAKFTAVDACMRLDIGLDEYYYNSGVLVANLDYWRKHNVSEKLLDFINNHRDKIKIVDQDALNAVLSGKRRKLSIKWNMLECFYSVHDSMTEEQKLDMKRWSASPGIIHWAEGLKPWMYGSYNPFKGEYYKYLRRTVWKDYKPSLKNTLQRFGYKRTVFLFLHLDGLYKKLARIKTKLWT